jgi:hypothetical protein
MLRYAEPELFFAGRRDLLEEIAGGVEPPVEAGHVVAERISPRLLHVRISGALTEPHVRRLRQIVEAIEPAASSNEPLQVGLHFCVLAGGIRGVQAAGEAIARLSQRRGVVVWALVESALGPAAVLASAARCLVIAPLGTIGGLDCISRSEDAKPAEMTRGLAAMIERYRPGVSFPRGTIRLGEHAEAAGAVDFVVPPHRLLERLR